MNPNLNFSSYSAKILNYQKTKKIIISICKIYRSTNSNKKLKNMETNQNVKTEGYNKKKKFISTNYQKLQTSPSFGKITER